VLGVEIAVGVEVISFVAGLQAENPASRKIRVSKKKLRCFERCERYTLKTPFGIDATSQLYPYK